MRAAAFAGALAVGASLVACGGSVADADRREVPRTTAPPRTPFCAAAQANVDALRPLNSLVARGNVPPAELSDTVAAVRRAGAEMLNTAPDDIRTDVERTVQAVELQLEVLEANGGDASALARDPQLSSRLGSAEFAGAGDRVRTYVERTCSPPAPTR
ncbi:hypothetical protein BJF78_08815 [Pseudonocardia sp. CNS-139]|nr:hypothetical protein BJF78_08815 [Pseudonocardia sp. CNS-139]